MEKIQAIIKTATFRQSGITFSTTILNGALGAVFYIVAARVLGPADFGVLSVSIMVLTLGTSVGGLGVNTGLVRFVGKYIKLDRKKADKFIKLSLKANIAIGFVFIVLGMFLSSFVANLVFGNIEFVEAIRISFFGVWFLLLFGFSVRVLQSFQKFWLWGFVQIGSNLLRILIVLLLAILGHFTLHSGLWTYILIPLAGFSFALLFLIPRSFLKAKNENSVAREFFHYNKWIAGFSLIAAVSSRMDTFITARLLSPEELGFYAAAYQLVYIVPQIVGSLGTVISPKMAAMGGKSEFLSYFKKTQLLVLGLSFLGLLAAPVVAFLVPYVFGAEYISAIPIFFVLLISMLVFLISVPAHNAVLYYYAYPRLFLWLSVGHLGIISLSAFYLINLYGVLGAAFSVLLGSIFNFVVPMGWVLNKLVRSQK